MSERKQQILLGWALVFLTIYGLALLLLFRMMPPPSATWTAQRIAKFYTQHSTPTRVGAVVASWTSGFEVPLVVVLGIQLARHEDGKPVWAIASVCAGIVSSLFLVLPPIFWGVAAFTPQRAPEITAAMHELGVLTLMTTTQYFIFMFVAVIVICLTPKGREERGEERKKREKRKKRKKKKKKKKKRRNKQGRSTTPTRSSTPRSRVGSAISPPGRH